MPLPSPSEPDPPSREREAQPWLRHLLTVIQFAVTIGLLAYLFHDPKRRADMAHAFLTADWRWLALSFLSAGVCEFFGVLRWQLFLRMLHIEVPLRAITRLFFIGAFFNQFLPGTTGGDVARVLYLIHDYPGHKTAGFLSVAVDRLLAVLVLVIIGLLIAWGRASWFAQYTATGIFMKWSTIALFIMAVALVASFILTSRQLVYRLPRRFPFRKPIIKLSKLWQLCLENRHEALLGAIYTVPMLFAYFAAFGFAAKAFSSKITFLDMTSIMPVLTVVSSVPLSLNGIGPREWLANELLHRLCHVEFGIGTVISLAGAGMYLIWGLLGGVFFLERLRGTRR
ncbi:lysylphosphatidylglycerol synthase transmembrane domain-containing protein [soil metagenome]